MQNPLITNDGSRVVFTPRQVADRAIAIFHEMKAVAEAMTALTPEDREWVDCIVQPEYDRIGPEIDAIISLRSEDDGFPEKA